jgi:hypothetical protein
MNKSSAELFETSLDACENVVSHLSNLALAFGMGGVLRERLDVIIAGKTLSAPLASGQASIQPEKQ